MKGLIFQLKVKHAAYRILSFVGIIVLLVSLMAFTVSAADLNNNEFVDFNDYAEYEFATDNSAVTIEVSFPAEWNITFIDFPDSGLGDNWYYGNELYIEGATNPWVRLNMHPMGGKMTWNTNVGNQITNCHFIDLRYIPDGTTLTYEFHLGISTPDVNLDEQVYTRYFFFVDDSGKVISRERHYFPPKIGSGNYTWSEKIDVSTFPEGAVGLVPMFVLRNFNSEFSDVYVSLSSFKFVIPMSALEFQTSQNEQLKATMKSIESALEDQDKKMDDILTGGEAGDDLIAGGDKLEQAGSDMGDDLGQIQDFEDQYMGQLDDNIDDVIKGAELTWIYPALAFVQRYLNKIVAGIPSKYLIIFTLPMFFGLFMYIVGHPIRAPRPDTSGDQVTRETFTTTEILTGKGAGNVRTTRTTTTSREIGRVHDK